MEHLISNVAHKEGTLEWLSTCRPTARQLALEFSLQMNVKIGVGISGKPFDISKYHNHTVSVYTNEGYPLGYLKATNDKDGDYYLYDSEFIAKQRASARSTRQQRDAQSIPLLVRSCRKYRDIPSKEMLHRHLSRDIEYVVSPTKPTEGISIGADGYMVVELLRAYTKRSVNPKSVEKIEELCQTLAKKEEEHSLKSKTYRRFVDGGFTFIGIFNNHYRRKELIDPYSDTKCMYMVADVTKTGVSPKNEVIFQLSNERFVNSLSDVPEIVSDVTILSTYFRSNPKSRHDDEENDLSVWFCDQYFEDADVSVGYRSRDFLCVAIPKTHELS